jgi:hypothetical protein
VSRALRLAIVRAEAAEANLPGCDFSIKGTPSAAASGHVVDLAKSAAQANGTQLDDATQKLIDRQLPRRLRGCGDDDRRRSAAN